MKRLLTVISLVLLALPLVFGAPTGGTTSAGVQETGSGTAATSVSTQGGNITEVNISGTSITGRWADFYGEVSGAINLSTSSNTFYQWSVSNVTGAVVYASNGTISDWAQANLAAGANGNMPAYVQGAAADNYTNTFNASEAFTSSSLTVAGVNYASTWQNGAYATNFKTYHLRTVAETANVLAAKVVADLTDFKGATSDYQLLAPANSTATGYTFYLELP